MRKRGDVMKFKSTLLLTSLLIVVSAIGCGKADMVKKKRDRIYPYMRLEQVKAILTENATPEISCEFVELKGEPDSGFDRCAQKIKQLNKYQKIKFHVLYSGPDLGKKEFIIFFDFEGIVTQVTAVVNK